MINGTTSRITNVGVILIVLVCIIGVIFLASSNDDIPSELGMVLTAAIGFLVGTKFTPIDGSAKHRPYDEEPTV